MSAQPTLEGLAAEARRSYRTVEDMVHHLVREGIVTGIYRPGQRLPQEAIAKLMGVSRIPVRAALGRLDAEGWVEMVPHRGAMVRSLSPNEIVEIYDLRIQLEIYALRAVADRINLEGLDELDRLAERIDKADGAEEEVDARHAFYERLYEISDRPLTVKYIARLRSDVRRYWRMERIADGREGKSHTVIVKALRHADLEEAAAWLRDHLTRVAEELRTRVASGAVAD